MSQSRILVSPAGLTPKLLLSDACDAYAPVPVLCGLKRDCPYVTDPIIHMLKCNRRDGYCIMDSRLIGNLWKLNKCVMDL